MNTDILKLTAAPLAITGDVGSSRLPALLLSLPLPR